MFTQTFHQTLDVQKNNLKIQYIGTYVLQLIKTFKNLELVIDGVE